MPVHSPFFSPDRITRHAALSDVSLYELWEVSSSGFGYFIPAGSGANPLITMPDNHENVMIISRIYFSLAFAVSLSDFYTMLIATDGPYNTKSAFDFDRPLITNDYNARAGVFFTGPGVDLKTYINFYGPDATQYKDALTTVSHTFYSTFPGSGIQTQNWIESDFVSVGVSTDKVPKQFYNSYQFTVSAPTSFNQITTSVAIYTMA